MKRLIAVAALLAVSVPAGAIQVQKRAVELPASINQKPEILEAVKVTERLGEFLPPDLTFTDHTGRQVRLGDYLQGDKPILLNLVYYRCPMLCTLVLNGVVEGMQGLPWRAGDRYRALTFSIDPRETVEHSREVRPGYIKMYGTDVSDGDWVFHTGTEEEIRALADAVGFGYRFDAARNDYAHAAVTILLSPRGRVVRYLYGISTSPENLKLGLLEASEGRIGNPFERALLYCYEYNNESRGYTMIAMNVMKLGGGLTVLILGGVLAVLWRREWKHKSSGAESEVSA